MSAPEASSRSRYSTSIVGIDQGVQHGLAAGGAGDGVPRRRRRPRSACSQPSARRSRSASRCALRCSWRLRTASFSGFRYMSFLLVFGLVGCRLPRVALVRDRRCQRGVHTASCAQATTRRRKSTRAVWCCSSTSFARSTPPDWRITRRAARHIKRAPSFSAIASRTVGTPSRAIGSFAFWVSRRLSAFRRVPTRRHQGS